MPEDEKSIANEISHGLGGLAQQVVVSLVNPVASGVSLFAQGVDQQGERQEATGTEGKTLESDLALLGGGVITDVLEIKGKDKLLDRVPRKIKNDVLRQVTDVALAGGIEAVHDRIQFYGIKQRKVDNPTFRVVRQGMAQLDEMVHHPLCCGLDL